MTDKNPQSVYEDKLIGTHIKKGKTILHSLKSFYKNYSFDIPVQLFTGSPRSFKRREIDEKDVEETFEYIHANGINCYIHSSYVINLARVDNFEQMSCLQYDLNLGKLINSRGVVVHVGKNVKDLKITREMAIDNMEMNMRLLKISPETPLLLETPAGQGTELLTTIEKFSDFMNRFKDDNCYGICVDTCHVFATGYHPMEYIKRLTIEFNHKIDLIHLNDSKEVLSSRKDRHAPVGMGHIGEEELFLCACQDVNTVTEY